MFDKEIKFIADFCLNKINKDSKTISLENLRALDIHPAIVKYISADLDYKIYQDRRNLLQNSTFDYSSKTITKYLKMISEEIKKSIIFSKDEAARLINNAIVFNINFTTKPNQTLINFIYVSNQSRTPDELSLFLNYTYYYSHLNRILTAYFEKTHPAGIARNDFENLLKKIDEQLFSVKPKEIIDDAVDAIADFFNIGSLNQLQISPQAIEAYLMEKKLDDYLAKFQLALSKSIKPKFEIEEIKRIFRMMHSDSAKSKDHSDLDIKAAESDLSTEESSLKISNELRQEIKSLPIDEIIDREPSQPESDDVEPQVSSPNIPLTPSTKDLSEAIPIENNVETFPIDSDALNELSRKTNDEVNKNLSGSDILSHLSNREIEKIISTIFNEDKEDFATTIEAISECKTYEKATEILRTLYTTYNVNPYSREAILLTNAVAKYFTTA